VILDRSEPSVHKFLSSHAHAGASATHILELLELQRNAMLMYTSCGWFFADVSGIETVQVLHYAGRVLQLAERFGAADLEPAFLERLAHARSNVAERGTARQIYESEVRPARLDLVRVAAHYAVMSLFDTFDDFARVYCYEVTRRDFELHKAGRARLAIGSIEVRSIITRESASFELAALHLGETELAGGVRPARDPDDYADVRTQLKAAFEPGGLPTLIRALDTYFGETPLSIRSLFRDEQRRVLRELIVATLEEAESAFRQLHERYDPIMRYHTRLGVPMPKVLQTAAAFDLNLQLRRLLESDVSAPAEIEQRLRQSRDEQVSLDETTLMAFRDAVDRACDRFRESPDDLGRLERFDTLVTIVHAEKLPIDLRHAQNRYYRMRNALRPAIEQAAQHADFARQWLEQFDALGEKLSIVPETAAVTQ
jgi:hypothetical protein